jgi:hypothetical protein
MLVVCVLLISLLLAGGAQAHFNGRGHMHKIFQTQQMFENPDCHSTDTCDLKRFALTTAQYEAWFSDDPEHPTYGNGTIIEYETDTVESLEKYAVVQFKKGCVYYTGTQPDEARMQIRDLVPSFGAEVPFCFGDWVIDSQDTDPVYNSDPEYGRFYLLRWNKPGSYEQRTQKFYGAEKPKRPKVYLIDYPAGAFVTRTGVRNVALAFRTCIYKATEVPVETTRTNLDFARAVHCLEWDNVYVYNHASRVFQPTWPVFPAPPQPEVRPPAVVLILYALLFVMLAAALLFLVSVWRRRRGNPL